MVQKKEVFMVKSEIVTMVIILLVAFSAVGLMFYSDSVGQAWFRKSMIQRPTMPAPKLAPPAPTPVPRPIPEGAERKTEKKEFLSSEAKYYLQPGKHTTPGPEIKNIKIMPRTVEELGLSAYRTPGWTPSPKLWEEDKKEFNIIRGIFDYLKSFNKFYDDHNCKHCWRRDVNNVFINGISNSDPSAKTPKGTCAHYALLFITLARLHNIPAKYSIAYYTNWADKQKNKGCWDGSLSGHVYAKIYVDGEWYAVDPTQKTFVDMDEKGNILDSKGNVKAIVIAEGRDNTDFMRYNEKDCLEGLRYHAAIPGLLLCSDAPHPPNANQLMMMLACDKPLKKVEFIRQKKGER